ncbi:hypothetical protein KAR91_04155, partial [Candidatus Pacearchaeota archaeon]|nr:hypothetical protein [Candidatus Pacearchaeota archaeon]
LTVEAPTTENIENLQGDYSRDQRLPEGLKDPRLLREEYRAEIKTIQTQLKEGGGQMGTLVGGEFTSDENTPVGQNSDIFRLKSKNPDWFIALNKELGHQIPIKEVKAAVDKALNAEKLGVREARYIEGMLNKYEGDRTDPQRIEYAKQELKRARNLRKHGLPADYKDEYADIAGNIFEEEEYDADWDAETRSLNELFNQAADINQDEADRILQDVTEDTRAASELWSVINSGEKQHDIEDRTTQTDEGTPGQTSAGRDQAETAKEELDQQRDSIPVQDETGTTTESTLLDRVEPKALEREPIDLKELTIDDALKQRTVKGTKPTKGLSVQEVEKVLSPEVLAVHEKVGLNLKVVASHKDLPARVQSKIKPGELMAGVMDGNTVYIVASNNVSEKEAIITYSHEVVGHVGMEAVVGEGWSDVIKQIDRLNKLGNERYKTIMDEVHARYGTDLDEKTEVQEFIALAVEQQVKEGAVGTLIKKIRQAIRKFLKSIGITRILSDADLDSLIQKSRDYLKTGKVDKAKVKSGTSLFSKGTEQPVYYSAAIKAVNDMQQKKGTPQQFIKAMEKAGVKKEEIDWLDIAGFMEDKKTVTKDELIEFIRANQVQVREVDETTIGATRQPDVYTYTGSDYTLEQLEEAYTVFQSSGNEYVSPLTGQTLDHVVGGFGNARAMELIMSSVRRGETLKQAIEDNGPNITPSFVEDIFGGILKREEVVTDATVHSLPITDKMREAAQQGQPLFSKAPKIDSPAFKNWFGDSIVVDDNGDPLVIYHGSKIDITEFTETKTKDGGFHFGTKSQAEMRNIKKVMPVYLKIKKIKRIKDGGDGWIKKIRIAKSSGYDGIIYLNRFEGIPVSEYHTAEERGVNTSVKGLDRLSDKQFKEEFSSAKDSYIAFNPEQIKSATGNRGTFDPTSPNILFSKKKNVYFDGKDVDFDSGVDLDGGVESDLVKKSKSKIKSWFKRNFTKEGLMNKIAFEIKLKSDATKNVGEEEIAYLIHDFEKVIKSAYGKRYNLLDKKTLNQINDYLSGNDKVLIPKSVKESVDNLRSYLDVLSGNMIESIYDILKIKVSELPIKQREQYELALSTKGKEGKIHASIAPSIVLMQTIASNQGTYLNRSYKAFDDEGWKEHVLLDKTLMKDAEAFIKEN